MRRVQQAEGEGRGAAGQQAGAQHHGERGGQAQRGAGGADHGAADLDADRDGNGQRHPEQGAPAGRPQPPEVLVDLEQHGGAAHRTDRGGAGEDGAEPP